ncbi:hypothetical protein D5S17_09235 [Pseudonocardiaceae bacterium YIM PH 21723]|nr:hypothetical protein D5S17_09235 [Pseudonocardiaceae bacterium YIM PH 21723]
MYSMLQSRRARGLAGEPLPSVFTALEQSQVRFVRGQLGLLAGGPGCGKTALALTLALRMGVPALYFSADSDAFVQLARTVAIVAGWSMEQATDHVRRDDLDSVYTELAGVPIRMVYLASPGLDDIELSLQAYEEVYGEYPHLTVLDNITNVRESTGPDGSPNSGLEPLMDWLHEAARGTQAHVLGLHHVTGPFNDADKPIPLSGLKGQVGRVPALVATIHRRRQEYGPDRLLVSSVKNRTGSADASGQSFAELEFDAARMAIRDLSY